MPDGEFTADHIRSKSVNTPYTGTMMHGKALAVFNKGQLVRND